MGQHSALNLLKSRPRLDPKLIDELPASPLVALEGIDLAARAVQRDHQLLVQLLSQRVLVGERLELGNESGVPSQPEVGVDPGFECGQPHLLQP